MSLQSAIRSLLPNEDRFYDFLEQQAVLAHEGAVALSKIKDGSPKDVQAAVHVIEKKGDKVSHDCEDALALTFVTPLDREDIHRLSTLLDDVLDRAYATASAFVMFHIDKPSQGSEAFFDLLVSATNQLKDVMPALRKHDFDRIREVSREVKKLEKEGDNAYREAMSSLFAAGGEKSGPYRDVELDFRGLIREKEVLEILEEALDNCEDVMEFLVNLAVKHG